MNQALKTLPGIYFETVLPQQQQALPRMDIGAFVGFAQKGPLHTPVPIEDTARLREIFGEDIALAWDYEQGAYEYSYLGAAVETFFKNGGRRCWVVRVADQETATTHGFRLPGLCYIGGGGIEKMEARTSVEARSPGSWSRLLRVGTALEVTQLYLNLASMENVLELGADGWLARVTSLPKPMYPGDLLELSFDDTDARLFLSVSDIESNIAQGIRLSGQSGYWLYQGSLASPPVAGAIETGDGNWVYPVARTANLGHPTAWLLAGSESPRPRIRLLRFELQAWSNGVLENRLSDLAFHPAHPRFWGNLPSDAELFASIDGKPAKILNTEVKNLVDQATQPRFPLSKSSRLTDKEILSNNDYSLDKISILPLGMGFTTDIEHSFGANEGYPAKLAQQDGLEAFDIKFFLDKNLYQVNSAALLREAEHRAYVKNQPDPLQGIHSLIANVEITMISVPDAVHRRWDTIPPLRKPGLKAPLLHPVETSGDQQSFLLQWDPVGGATSYWLQRDNSSEFSNPVQSEIRNDSLATSGELPDLLPVPPTRLEIEMPVSCPENVYIRVRTEYLGEVSPWSNTRVRLLPTTSFEDCGLVQPQLLEVVLDEPTQSSPPDTYQLTWHPGGELFVSADKYRLQVSMDMEYASIVTTVDVDTDSYSYKNETEGLLYFRVRALKDKTTGPWSNTISIEPYTLNKLTLQSIDRFSDYDLMGIHRSLLRLSAARADILSVLTLPRHYKAQHAIDHVAMLKPLDRDTSPGSGDPGYAVLPLGHGESHALSYAAIYHPWAAVTASDDSGQSATVRTIPADGIVIGSMARIAADYGAWIAPANDLFTDIVALDQKLTAGEKIQLLSAQINLLEQDARGFLAMSTDTLAVREEYRLINVRRLLILVRRLALVEGHQFVFEPNSGSFRDRVQNKFEGFMSDMFIRGAFSGATPQQAFQVITDRSVNTQRRIDRGQFIIELQIAPSKPMTFLTVRLVQSGLNEIAAQEI